MRHKTSLFVQSKRVYHLSEP